MSQASARSLEHAVAGGIVAQHREIQGHENQVTSLAVSRDGNYLAWWPSWPKVSMAKFVYAVDALRLCVFVPGNSVCSVTGAAWLNVHKQAIYVYIYIHI